MLVAHRLSTVREAELIFVLQRGRIVQEGTHQQLLAQKRLYRTLWQAQTGEADGPLGARPAVAARGSNGHGPAALEGASHA